MKEGYKLNRVRMIDDLFYVTDFILLNRSTLQMKEGYKLNRVGMMDLSVLCEIFYPTEQGYITGERGVHIK
jgi:hypothetical protein